MSHPGAWYLGLEEAERESGRALACRYLDGGGKFASLAQHHGDNGPASLLGHVSMNIV